MKKLVNKKEFQHTLLLFTIKIRTIIKSEKKAFIKKLYIYPLQRFYIA